MELRKNGRSTAEILDHLNETYTPPPAVSNKKHSKWSRAMVERLFHTRALIGIKEISVDGVNYELNNYYPRVIDDPTFYHLKKILVLEHGTLETRKKLNRSPA